MDYSLISVRYAKALFVLSKEKGLVEVVYKDMELICNQCDENKEFCNIIDSPIITPLKKKKMFKTIFETHINELTMNFLALMVENKREALLKSIARNFIDFYKKEKGVKTVHLYTAVKLDNDYVSHINTLLEKELDAQIELIVRVRDNLIGGFILMIDGKMMDTSISNKLKQLKKKLLS